MTSYGIFGTIRPLVATSWIFACILLVLGCEQPNPSASSVASHATSSAAKDSGESASVDTSVQPSQPEPRDDRPRIVAFGDSLTAGFGVPADRAYPAQLQSALTSRGYYYEVINAGVSGETTAGGRRRLPWILKSIPDIVILELGANDGLRGLSLTDTRANLDAIIRALKDAGVRVVLAGMKLPPNYGEDYTRRFESMYGDLASGHHIALIPFFLEGVGGKQDLNQPDGIHPTEEGYRILSETVLKALVPLLPQPGSVGRTLKKKA
jgi:acyl-CoA thioesterase-1